MVAHAPAVSPAREKACRAHAALSAGRILQPVQQLPADGLLRAPGEYAVGVFPNLAYARYRPADLVVVGGGPAVVIGSVPFVAGFAMGTLAQRAVRGRRARRAALPQWRYDAVTWVVVTTHRLWCLVDGQTWVWFDYSSVTALDLTNEGLVLTFQQAYPLRLSGDWAAWIAVAVAHYTFGRDTAARMPCLAALAPPDNGGRPAGRPHTATASQGRRA